MIRAKLITNKKTWEKFILKNTLGNFLQSWAWGEFQKKMGAKIFRLGFFQNNRIHGQALLILQKAKRAWYLECPAGPVIPWNKQQFFQAFIAQAKLIAKKEKCSFIRTRPDIVNNPANKRVFSKNGFIKAPMHLHAETTWQLDLDPSQDTLLSNMRKSTRYLVRKSKKEKIKIVSSTNPKDIQTLYDLQIKTARHSHFVPFPKKYLLNQFEAFVSDNTIRLFKAIHNNKILAIAFIIFYGKKAVYHYSASAPKARKIPVSYALQWHIINYAKKKGCRIYDFWGIAPGKNKKHRFYGVTLFKTGFGGFRINYLPAHDLPINILYWPVYLFETWRHFHRRL